MSRNRVRRRRFSDTRLTVSRIRDRCLFSAFTSGLLWFEVAVGLLVRLAPEPGAPCMRPFPRRGGKQCELAGEEHFRADGDQRDSEDAAQPHFRDMLCTDCAEVAAHQESRGEKERDTNVCIAFAVVLDEGK